MHGVRYHHRCAPVRGTNAAKPWLETLLIRSLGIVTLGLGTSLVDAGIGIASDQSPAQARPDSPAQVYRLACLQCHDADGRGTAVRDTLPSIPDFTNSGWHASRDDEDLGRAILEGKGAVMRPMKKKLGSLDVTKMVSFVRAFRGGGVVVLEEDRPLESPTGPALTDPKAAEVPVQPDSLKPLRQPLARTPAPPVPSARPSTAGTLFRRHCTSCHGQDGRASEVRSAMPSIPDFSSRHWQEGRVNAHLAASILEGKGALMPAWRGRLSTEQANELVAFVRSLGPPDLAPGKAPASEFRRRFHQLQEQWDDLDRQAKALQGR
jgi:mono/diheme cytochrome c family protein